MAFRKSLIAVTLLLTAWSTAQAAKPAAPAAKAAPTETAAPLIDEKAEAVLHQMSAFLAKQERFRVQASRSIDLVLDNGQKIQADSVAEVSVQRPDGIRVNRKGVRFDQQIYFNGKEFALNRSTGLYATAEAPATIDEFLDRAIDNLKLVPPGADLLYADPYKVLTEDMSEAIYVGVALIDGARCHHLAFRNGNAVDWQIWIKEGDHPLPCKMVVTARDNEAAPQFVAYFSKWDFYPQFAADEFTFTPPQTAIRIGIANVDDTQAK
jgi:hypothetical protein